LFGLFVQKSYNTGMSFESPRAARADNNESASDAAIEVRGHREWPEVDLPNELSGVIAEQLALIGTSEWEYLRDRVFKLYGVSVDEVQKVKEGLDSVKVVGLIVDFTRATDETERAEIGKEIAHTIKEVSADNHS
jgi:hypothetical protein